MRRAAKIAGLILLTLGLPAFARAQAIYSNSCPAATTPVIAPSTTTIDNTTGLYKRQWCVDNNGNLYSIGNITHSGDPNLSSVTPGWNGITTFLPAINTFDFNGYWASVVGVSNADVASFGLTIPASATVFQANGTGSYVKTSSPTTNAVAGFFSMQLGATGAHGWGINPIFDDSGFAGTGSAAEFDCNIRNLSTTGSCIQLTGGAWTGSPASYPAIHISKPGGGQWNSVFTNDSGAYKYFSNVDDAAPESLGSAVGSSGNTYFTIYDGGNLGMQSGFNTAGSIYWWMQARNNQAISTAYPIRLNPLGGAVQQNVPQAIGTQSVSGCSLSGAVGGAWAGKFTSGTTGTCTVTITPGITAANGFACWAKDLTTPADEPKQTATSTTTATLSWTTVSGDVITWGCAAF